MPEITKRRVIEILKLKNVLCFNQSVFAFLFLIIGYIQNWKQKTNFNAYAKFLKTPAK